MFSNPEAPSTITSRASCSVGAISAMRRAPRHSAARRTHSAPARVLPAPRPPKNNQTRQSPVGGLWALFAQTRRKFHWIAAASRAVRVARKPFRFAGAKVARQSALNFSADIVKI